MSAPHDLTECPDRLFFGDCLRCTKEARDAALADLATMKRERDEYAELAAKANKRIFEDTLAFATQNTEKENELEEKLAAAQAEIVELRRVLKMVSPDVRTSDWDCQILDALASPTAATPLLEAIREASHALKFADDNEPTPPRTTVFSRAIAALAVWASVKSGQ